jgi:hypothetical protein
MDEKCIICDNNIDNLITLIDDKHLMYCHNCFHISSFYTNKPNKIPETFNSIKVCNEVNNRSRYKDICFKQICDKFKDKDEKFNVLCLNDYNTDLLDMIKTEYKYSKTVSLSNYFNPSFFSKHYHEKDYINDNSIKRLRARFDSFDFIFINTTLNGCNDPVKFLELCKLLCHENTIVFSLNYHSIRLSCYYLMNLNDQIKHIYNTNSIKFLCQKTNFCIANVEDITKDLKLYIFKAQLSDTDSILSEILYDEITHDTYDNETYDSIKYFWMHNFINFSQTLEKYKNKNFTIIGINKCECCLVNTYYTKTQKIDLMINLSDLSNKIKIFNKSENFLFIIFDEDQFFAKGSKLITLLSSKQISKSLIFDPVECISYPIK